MPPPRQTQVKAHGIERRVEREADGVVLWKPEYDLMQKSREAGIPGMVGGLDARRAWEEEGGAEAAGDVDAGVLFVADGRGGNGPGVEEGVRLSGPSTTSGEVVPEGWGEEEEEARLVQAERDKDRQRMATAHATGRWWNEEGGTEVGWKGRDVDAVVDRHRDVDDKEEGERSREHLDVAAGRFRERTAVIGDDGPDPDVRDFGHLDCGFKEQRRWEELTGSIYSQP